MSKTTTKPETEESEASEASGQVGQSPNSKFGEKYVTGNGEYVDDINFVDQLHARFVRSTQAHARISNIDTSDTEAMPGVELVWTAADIEPYVEPFGHPMLDRLDDNVLATDKVRYVGDEVAVVVAEDQNTAIEAADRVQVDYESLDVVTKPEEALADDAPVLYQEFSDDPDSQVDGNLLDEKRVTTGDTEAAFEEADIVVEGSFKTNLTNPCPMEPHGAVAKYNSGIHEMEIWSSNQVPHTLPGNLADAVNGISEDDIVAHMPDVGGAFGAKGGHEVYAHEVVVAVLTMQTNRPVKLMHDRLEALKAGRGRASETFDGRLAISENGDLLGWKIDLLQNTGAIGSYGPAVAFSGSICGSGPFLIPNQEISIKTVYTNTMPSVAVRGFGDPQYSFIREQLIDMAAEELGMDRLEIRLRNIPEKEDLPMISPTKLKWNSGDMPECINRVKDLINWDEHSGGYETRDDKLRGVGIGCVMRRCGNKAVEGSNYESALVRMRPSGQVTVYCGISNVGQGTETALCQIVAETLGLSVDDVKPVVGDSELTPDGLGVWADRGTIFGGTATSRAAENLKAKMRRLAAHLLGIDGTAVEFVDRRIIETGNPDNGMDIEEFAHAAFYGDQENRPDSMKEGISLVGEAKFESRDEEIPDMKTGTGNLSHVYSFGALATLVEVDPGTGEIEVIDIAAVEDAGTIINPKLVEGQIQGGAVMALGETLLEGYQYTDGGNLKNGTYVDYHLPTAADVPMITKLDSVETPTPTTSHGQKGVGEFSIVPVNAAVANAVYDATGLRFHELPFSPDKILPRLTEAGINDF